MLALAEAAELLHKSSITLQQLIGVERGHLERILGPLRPNQCGSDQRAKCTSQPDSMIATRVCARNPIVHYSGAQVLAQCQPSAWKHKSRSDTAIRFTRCLSINISEENDLI